MKADDFLKGPNWGDIGKARKALILLHGYGANGDDLINLAPILLEGQKDVAAFSPHAPQPCLGLLSGRQWFALNDISQKELDEGAAVAQHSLEAGLKDLLVKLDIQSFALFGFSQGAMMVLQVGLRMEPTPALLMGFSGALPNAESLEDDVRGRADALKPPVLLVHGKQDEVVPFRAMERAAHKLEILGIDTRTHAREQLGHGIDEGGIILAQKALERSFF